MKNNFILLGIIILTGYASASLDISREEGGGQKARFYFNQVYRVKLGMSREQVRKILGAEMKIGFAEKNQGSKDYEALTISNPYKTEQIEIKENIYEVDYYYTDVKKADGIISDDELVPLVYENGKLIGQGRDYLFRARNQ